MRLMIFAGHVQHLAADPAPAKMKLSPVKGLVVEVRIEPSTMSADGGPIWDNVWINGKLAGNRWGGISEFVRLTEAALRASGELTYDLDSAEGSEAQAERIVRRDHVHAG